MKKKLLASLLCLGMVCQMFAGCGKEVKTEAKMKTLADYKGIEVEKSVATVTDKQIEEKVESDAKSHSTDKKLVGVNVKDKDKVNIDYTGKIDGQKIDSESGSDKTITIGSGTMPNGFETSLVDKKIGDTVTFKLTLPSTYKDASTGETSQYAGKEVEYEVKLNNVVQTIIPEVNDAYVKKYYSYTGNTVKEYKEYIANDLKTSQFMEKAFPEYVKKCEVETYDSEKLKSTIQNYTDYYEYMYYMQYKADLKTYLEAMSMSRKDWDADIEKQSKEALKMQMVIDEIAGKENITVSDSDYEKEAKAYALKSSYKNVKELESAIGGKDGVVKSLINEKVYKVMVDNIKVVDDKKEEATK